MSKKRMTFPMEVQEGSVTVKIYRIKNKSYRVTNKDGTVEEQERFSFSISYFADGKRKMKMFADFNKAHAEATSKAKTLSRGELDVLELRSNDRLIYTNALRAIEPTGLALDLVAKEYAELWKILGGKASPIEAVREFARRYKHTLPDKTVPAAVDELLAAKKLEGASEIYRTALGFYLGKFSKAFKCQVRTVTTAQLSDFFSNMKVSPRSKNNQRQAVGVFFNFCKQRGWLPKDHEGIDLVPKFKEKPTDIEIFTPEEITHFLTHAPEALVPFLAIGAFAGLRTAEIVRLDWSEVNVADRFIELKAAKAKTASRRIVPITENLAKWLTPHVEKEGRVMPYYNITKQIGLLVERTNAGLKKVAKKAGGDPDKVKKLEWKKNALRHSFISYRVADVQNVAQVALECGNSPKIIFAHYRELVRPGEAKKWFGILPEGCSADPQPKSQSPAAAKASEPTNVIPMSPVAA